MTNEQQQFLESLEIYLAKLSFEGYDKEARKLAPVVELIDSDNSFMAYLEAEALGMDDRVLKMIKDKFDLRI